VKRIPVAAGLGGGSADAAAALLALDELWGCTQHAGEELLAMAAQIGSDVPALLTGGPAAVIRGRGEIVEPVEVPPSWWVLLPLPFPVAVTDAYRWWDEDGGVSLPAGASGRFVNDLEPPVSRRHPEIRDAEERLLAAGATAAIMCGSGPTVAGLADDEAHAERIAEVLPGSIPVSAPP
jgi:4-diphosphocytidyl-2-C-methyl-D-erythritol kinase